VRLQGDPGTADFGVAVDTASPPPPLGGPGALRPDTLFKVGERQAPALCIPALRRRPSGVYRRDPRAP
jgi:hypothetical protein